MVYPIILATPAVPPEGRTEQTAKDCVLWQNNFPCSPLCSRGEVTDRCDCNHARASLFVPLYMYIFTYIQIDVYISLYISAFPCLYVLYILGLSFFIPRLACLELSAPCGILRGPEYGTS